MENNTPKKREWVKNAAIAFLAVMLVLTFFSNTIMNHTLPEVATAEVQSGAVTAKVRGTGTVSALGNTKVKAVGTTSIASVKVKEGQEVNEGDVLLIYGEATEELQKAEEELAGLEFQLQRAQVGKQSYVSPASVNAAMEKLTNAQMNLNDANAELDKAKKILDSDEIKKLEKEAKDAKDVLDLAQQAAIIIQKEKEDEYNTINAQYIAAKDKYVKNPTEANKQLVEILKDSANAALSAWEASKEPTAEESAAQWDYDRKQAVYENALTALGLADKQKAVEAAKAAVQAAEEALSAAEVAYESSIDANNHSDSTGWIDVAELNYKIERQKEKIDQLKGGEDNAVTAPVGGTVVSIEVSPGATVAKDDVLLTIEVPDMGYTMSCSVTNEQAKRLKVGDSATVSNFYWGSDIIATVSAIKTDPKDPQTKKQVTFDLEGEVTPGAEITVSVGQKSANYDSIVPNSAVRTDSNGTFVLVITAKNNALGNRYFVNRVAVDQLATDDNVSAISGNLGYGDFVVTTSSAPLKSGDQVRMADTSD